ncbi:MAG: threonine synthase [Candidatus Aminicenantes bacterium]|nr:threonine synthase [Candidatus Aminicenantes bacterium]
MIETLECLSCGKAYPIDIHNPFCPIHGWPLLVRYEAKRRRIRKSAASIYERYAEFLPWHRFDPALSLGEGGTPLLPLHNLADDLGRPGLLAKNEMMNPTGSFKDRGTVVAVAMALELGFRSVGTISTGNMAGSTAAYAAKTGLKCLIFVKAGTSREKITAAAVHGASVIKVRGDYPTLFRRSFEIGRARGIYFMNSVDPFRIEGYKIAGYEIFESLGPRAFDGHRAVRIFVPVSAGGHLIGLIRAFLDLKEIGAIQALPRFIGVQAAGCAPVAQAFEQGRDTVKRFLRPHTIAHAISNPFPPGGDLALRILRAGKGTMAAVTEREILRAQTQLAAREGLFCDPASAVTLAAAHKLGPGRGFDVLILTGSGLKTVEDVDAKALDVSERNLDDL